MSEALRTTLARTAVGELFVASTDRGVCVLSFGAERGRRVLSSWIERHATGSRALVDERGLDGVVAQLLEYGAGERRRFDLDLDLRGTPFQLAVWREMVRVPFGRTTTYGAIATRLERPGASRAVGLACGANPVPVVVPCHRVLARDGLGGFSAGIEHKRRLLAHEGSEFPLAAR